MKKVYILSILFLSLITVRLTAQITGASISGSFNVNSILTGVYSGTPTGTNTVSFEWFYSPNISLGISATYTISSADQGRLIYVTATEYDAVPSIAAGPFSSAQTIVNSFPLASYVSITGTPRSGMTLTGSYVFSDVDPGDSEGSSVYRWFTGTTPGGANPNLITSATTRNLTLTDAYLGLYIGFYVTPVSSSGSTTGAEVQSAIWSGPVTANTPPIATIGTISGPSTHNVNDVLIGNYGYTDAEGDAEFESIYKWYRHRDAGAGDSSLIAGETGIAYKLTLADTGQYIFFKVTPKAKTGQIVGLSAESMSVGPVNTPPYVTDVSVTGLAIVNQQLSGNYICHDGDNDPTDATTFRWLRNGTDPVPGAVSDTYTLTDEDMGSTIQFEVTPVTSSGYPNTGEPVLSAAVGPVTDPSAALPDAIDLCISGIRLEGEILTGKYTYVNKYKEKDSKYLWLRGKTVVKSGITDAHKTYTLAKADTAKVIRFAVIPKNKTQAGDTVFSEPLAIFTLARESFSAGEGPQILTATPSGGVFYGEGISDGKFTPSSVNYQDSPFLASYQLPIVKPTTTCLQTAMRDLEVRAVKMYFESFRDLYCQNGGNDTIYVKSIPKGSTSPLFELSDMNGFVKLLNDSAIIIDPSRMKQGDNIDFLKFRVMAGIIPIEIVRTFIIDEISQVSILNLEVGEIICNNIAPRELFVSLQGGVFQGPVVNGVLNPALTLGPANVKYTYTTTRGCVSSVTVPITINPAAAVAFAMADSCMESKSDTTQFINSTVSADPVINWSWEFSDAGGSGSSSVKEPGYLFRTGGPHIVTLSAITSKNCLTTREITIDLGEKPDADFFWKSECFYPNDSILLFDNTRSFSQVASRSWNFFDGDSLHVVKNPKYPKKTTGYLPVRLIVKTHYRGCHDTVFKEIFIRPTIPVPADGYFQDFESGNGGWVKDYDPRNSWSFGKPDRIVINTAASGESAWYTRYPLVNQVVDSSSVISPCFDFSSSDRPMIRLRMFRRFDRNRDGAALQYRIGEGDWHYIGSLDDGINWYNSTLIKGRPGGDQVGWTTAGAPDNKWIEARHTLDELKGEKEVKLRLVYGSDGTSQDNDGIAFDDIWIGERTRHVLLEHFTNTSSVRGSEATEMVNTIVLNNTNDIVNIQYHTNFPGVDPYYDNNPGDASARILFYGLTKAPYSFIDGGNRKDYANLFDYNLADINNNDLIRRSLINPLFDISLNTTVSNGVLSVSGKLTALENIDTDNLTLYLAVTEKENNDHVGAKNETVFYNVFRKFIPDAGGIYLKKTWAKGEVYSLPEKIWVINKLLNSSDISVVAFVQNSSSKELYQTDSEVIKNLVVGIENLPLDNGAGFILYPNPAVNKLTISFKEPLNSDSDIRIYNMQGRVSASFKAKAGLSEFVIENCDLRSGIYLLRISAGGIDMGFRKLIISGN